MPVLLYINTYSCSSHTNPLPSHDLPIRIPSDNMEYPSTTPSSSSLAKGDTAPDPPIRGRQSHIEYYDGFPLTATIRSKNGSKEFKYDLFLNMGRRLCDSAGCWRFNRVIFPEFPYTQGLGGRVGHTGCMVAHESNVTQVVTDTVGATSAYYAAASSLSPEEQRRILSDFAYKSAGSRARRGRVARMYYPTLPESPEINGSHRFVYVLNGSKTGDEDRFVEVATLHLAIAEQKTSQASLEGERGEGE